jgi:hypothetical protein
MLQETLIIPNLFSKYSQGKGKNPRKKASFAFCLCLLVSLMWKKRMRKVEK